MVLLLTICRFQGLSAHICRVLFIALRIYTQMIFLLLLFWTTSGSYYKVTSYYGYWNRNFYLYQNITQGKLRLFEMHGLVDAEPDSQVVYVADPTHHVIRVSNITASTTEVLSGTVDRGTGILTFSRESGGLQNKRAVQWVQGCSLLL